MGPRLLFWVLFLKIGSGKFPRQPNEVASTRAQVSFSLSFVFKEGHDRRLSRAQQATDKPYDKTRLPGLPGSTRNRERCS
jgi:hypothetical protein